MATEKMTNNADKRPFWAEYIRRCWENGTFKIPNSLKLSSEDRRSKLKNLREQIFTFDDQPNIVDYSFNKSDSITEAYKKHYQMKLKYIKGIMQWVKAHAADRKEESPSDEESVSEDEAILCNLEVENHHKALGHPLDPKKPLITLNGLKKRHCAFDGDQVLVALSKKDSSYGKVVKVEQKCHQKKYICRVDRYSTIHCHPIDKKTPTFVNLPMLSKAMLKYSDDDKDASLKSQLEWVAVFKENSLLSGDVPEIKEIIPARVANRLLFVVYEIHWHPKYPQPLGAVIKSLPLGTNFFHAEQLLRAAYCVQKDEQDKEVEVENKVVKGPSRPLPQGVVCQAFTIDPIVAKNLDDALSLVHEGDGMYTMAVLIANVGRQLKQGSDLDKRAQKRGNSVYGCNMIPPKVCQTLSLDLNEIRDVIIVFTKVALSQDGTVSINTADIKEGKLKSQVQLDYLEAQHLLSERSSDSLQEKIDQYSSLPGQPNLVQSLQHLYKIAMYLRVQRLGRAAYAYSLSKEEDKMSWQAHLLVEELMNWANNAVAEYVYRHQESRALLRRQAAPDLQELNALQSRYAGVLEHSVALNTLATTTSDSRLLIPHTILCELHKAIECKDAVQLQRLLTSDSLYPQLAAAARHMITISQRTEYVCSDLPITDSISPFHHHSLCLDYYTHFTSPIRRYCDVVVQRLLLSILNPGEYTAEQQEEYSSENLKKLCLHLNICSREEKKYGREVDQLKLAQKLGESCEETCAYVNKTGTMFEVDIPEVKCHSCLKREETGFHVSALVCKECKDGLLKWKVSIYSFEGNDFILKNPRLCQFKESQDTTEKNLDSSTETATTNMTVFYRKPEDDSNAKTLMKDPFSEREDVLLKLQLCAAQTQEVVAVNPEQWQSVIKKIDNLTDNTIQELSAALPKVQPQKQNDKQVHDQAKVERFEKSPILKYEVACKLGSNSIVPIWLGQTLLREPILSPCLQLMEVAPELRICLQHNKHPAECFSDTQLEQASKGKYNSLEEYIKLWEKVFLAEAAESSVINREKQLILLKAVPLQWPNLAVPETSTEDYVVPQGLVTLTIPPERRHFLQYNVQISPGDLVCVRYDVKKKDPEQCCKAVYHLVVKNVYGLDKEETIRGQLRKLPHATKERKKKKDLPLVIEMEDIASNSCQISSKMANILKQTPPPPCELQIINLQESFK